MRPNSYYYTVSQKSIPDIFDCNLKSNYQILILFSRNIPGTTCRQKLFSFPPYPTFFCTTWGKHSQQNITFLSNTIWLLN